MTLGERLPGETSAASHGGIDINIADALADLDTIDATVLAQTAVIIAKAATTYETRARATTPVGKAKKRDSQRLSTGWQRRVKDPYRVYVVNIRPHAHLAAMGWEHVGGEHLAPFVPWIKEAIQIREAMVDDLTRLLGPAFPARLRALEMVTL